MSACLYCYEEINSGSADFHPSCSRKIFGKPLPPALPYTEDQMLELASEAIRSQKTIPGVQAKLSLDVESNPDSAAPQRFTIVGLWGEYILKPPTAEYPNLPELEDATMHLAELAGIATVPHSLIRLQNGIPAYITRRIDRVHGTMVHLEDMCQLTERLTEHKYNGSYEQIGRAIIKYSANPMLDVIAFFEQVLFSFLTGNADMHLKNFSLIASGANQYVLAPAYDMVATALVVVDDTEELALTLNGKKRKITRRDFAEAMDLFRIQPKTRENIYAKFRHAIPGWIRFLAKSFIPEIMQQNYSALIEERAERMDLANNH